MTAPKNPRPLGFPVDVPAEQVFENLRQSRATDAARLGRHASRSAPADANLQASVPQLFDAERRATAAPMSKAEQFRASYLVGDTTPSTVDLSNPDLPGPMLLDVTTIACFDHNPRLFENDKQADIRSSIVTVGFHDALVVTRRRPGDRFMLAAGSNTTLRIVQELFQETGDDKYRWVNCIFQPYQGDARLLAQHLGENLNRGDMKFWEIAKGMTELLRMIADERRRSDPSAKLLGLREQAEELTRRGLRADKSSVARWVFAVDRLAALGPATICLSKNAVADVLQPRINALKALAAKFRLADADFWDGVVTANLAIYAKALNTADPEGFDPVRLCERIETGFAVRVDEPLANLRQMLSTLKLAPELTLADLRQPSPNLIFGGQSATSVSTPSKYAQEDRAGRDVGQSGGMQQAVLPIGPGLVRQAGAVPAVQAAVQAAEVGGQPEDSIPSRSLPSAAPGHGQEQRQAGSATGASLFEANHASDPPLQTLHAAVLSLLASLGLHDALYWRPDMPLGFYVEIPQRIASQAGTAQDRDSDAGDIRLARTIIWWTLGLLSGQFHASCMSPLDLDGLFCRHFHGETGALAQHDSAVDLVPPELDETLMARVTPGPGRLAMQQLRAVEELVAKVFDGAPDRWQRTQASIVAGTGREYSTVQSPTTTARRELP